MSPRPIYAAVWTPKAHRVLRTKGEWVEVSREWKDRYRDRGWTVGTLGRSAYQASSPSGERHAIVLHTYDPVTKERLA